jgi:hypothetical protein
MTHALERNAVRACLVLTFLVGASGCCGKVRGLIGKKGAGGSAPLGLGSPGGGIVAGQGPIAVTFLGENFTVSTGGKGRVLSAGDDGHLSVTIDHQPTGAVLRAGEAEATIGAGGSTLLRADARKGMGGAKTDTSALYNPGLTLTLTFPDGRTGSAPIPPQKLNMFGLSKFLKSTIGQGYTFPDEPADTKRDIAYFAYAGGKFIGREGLLREVDLIIDLERGPTKSLKPCTGYKNKAGAPRTINIELKDTIAVATDRRTGKEVARKVFGPSTRCPSFLMQGKDDDTAESTPASVDAEKWAKTLLR